MRQNLQIPMQQALTSLFLLVCFFSRAQVVSQFNWNSNPITTAAVGPNATSAGGTATSSTGGVGGTNGLNPGAPTASDINLTVPNTGNIFDMSSIDVSIDYRRNESTAQMVRRGTFTFNTGGTVANFRVTYRVSTGTVVTTVSSTNVAIPIDAVFRNYRFTYDNCSGVGTAYVNNVVAWTSPTATPGQNLYWVGDGSVIIGQDMDGANNNVPNLDNFIWQNFACATLPIELINFAGTKEGGKNYFEWSTASEKNNDFFTIERSEDGLKWTEVIKEFGAGNSKSIRTYRAYDVAPESTLNYYRLKQTDFDGQSKHFKIVVIDNSETSEVKLLKTTDLLGREVDPDYQGIRVLFFSDGTVVKKYSH